MCDVLSTNFLKQITDNSENVFSLQWGDIAELPADQQDGIAKNMFNHLKNLTRERDDYSEVYIHFLSVKGMFVLLTLINKR